MTTAHRPTWESAKGSVKNHGFTSKHISAKDQNGETRLKYRQVGQSAKSEMVHRDLVEELEKREFDHLSEKNKLIAMIENEEKKVDAVPLLKERAEVHSQPVSSKYNDADIDTNDRDDDEDEFDSSSDEEDDDDDDEQELMRELEKIKAERAAAKAKQEADALLAEEQGNQDAALRGNPLLNLSGAGAGGSEKVEICVQIFGVVVCLFHLIALMSP
mmetsp:Transcript_16991/g.31980  ORF Transcript_16991/g.31980 Transcript_16991/m.31980 type:complete len:216 (+) Transcript_16991:42-689(+)